MSFDFAEAKRSLRQTVHDTFAVEATYAEDSISASIEIKARWHNKISRPFGDLDNGGYAEIIEGIDRIIFIAESIDEFPINLVKNGIVTFPTMLPGVEFQLDHEEDPTGPLERIWAVTRK